MPFTPFGGSTTQQPYQFRPESYGARGNGIVCADVATNGTTTITSPTIAAKGAAGMTVMINGANGAAAAPLVTTIVSLTGTGAVLANPAGVTASACATVFGNDDTAAINSAIAAASTYAQANDYFAEILFGAKIYMLTSGPTQTTSPAVQNSQIQIPFPAVNGQSQKLVIALTGAGKNDHAEYWESITPNLAGTVLVSTLTNAPSVPNGTFGVQSVVGGPSVGTGFTGSFANTKAVITGISVYVPLLQNMIAWDLGFVAGLHMDGCRAMGFAPAANLAAAPAAHPYLSDLPPLVAFQSTISRGLRTPVITNNDNTTIPSFAAEGFEVGCLIYDHATIGRLVTVYSDAAVLLDTVAAPSNKANLVSIANWSAENFNGGLLSNSGAGAFLPVDINMTVENAGGASPSYDISDANGTITGRVRWFGNGRTSNAPVVTGAAAVQIVNGNLGPGVWLGTETPAVPAAPATGVSQQNTSWRNATVAVTSTAAITAATVDGHSVFSGSIAIGGVLYLRVPAGHSFVVTSAGGTLTTAWTRDLCHGGRLACTGWRGRFRTAAAGPTRSPAYRWRRTRGGSLVFR